MYVGVLPVPLTAQIVAAPPNFTGRCPAGGTGWYITTVAADTTHGGSSIYVYNTERMRYELTSALNDPDPTSVWSTGQICYGSMGSNIILSPQAQNQASGLTMLRNGVPFSCAIDQGFGRDTVALEFFYCGS